MHDHRFKAVRCSWAARYDTWLLIESTLQGIVFSFLFSVRCCCRQAKAEYEGELKLQSLNNDHVGAKEWDWVWSMLQAKEGSITATANTELLAKAQEQASNTGITVP